MFGTDGIGESDCEAVGGGLFAQPVNAATSAAYVLAGIVLWLRLPKAERFRAGGLFALLLALIGIGSIVYHGPQLPGARLMHDLPIPGLLLLTVVVVLWRWRDGSTVFPGRSTGRLWVAIVAFVIAPIAYGLGRTGSPLCDADGEVQLHGVWHVLTAVGFVVVGEILFRPPAKVT